MDKKIKLIVIGLCVIAAISLIIAFQLQAVNRRIQEQANREIHSLQQEHESLTVRLSQLSSDNRNLNSALNEAESRTRGIGEEIKMLNERYGAIVKDRDSLVNKVQSLIEEKRVLKDGLDEEIKRLKAEIEDTQKKDTKETLAGAYAISPQHEAQWAEVLRQRTELQFELEGAKAQLRNMTFNVDALTREKNAIEMELKETVQLKDELDRRANYNERLANSLSEDLVREKNDKEVLSAQLDQIRQDNRNMRNRIRDLESTRATLYQKLDSLEQQRIVLQNKLKSAEGMLDERVREVVRMRNEFEGLRDRQSTQAVGGARTLELPPIVVQGKQEPSPSGSVLTGKVLSINKDYNFVIINLGEGSGIRNNDEFVIYRGNRFIGHTKVVQVRDEISAADITSLSAGEEVRVGDIVKKM